MQDIYIYGKQGESIIKFDSFFDKPHTYIKKSRTVIITDSIVYKLYGQQFPNCPVINIPSGEESKNFDIIEHVIKKLLDFGADRHWFLLGIGGGVVTDITGFAATIYMRGINFAFIPTTILAQADAAIGGKNGINIMDYKNIAGTINQPEFILCDTSFFKTLNHNEHLNGYAEIIKYALIQDPELFAYLDENHDKIVNADSEVIQHIIYRSCEIKADIVNKDEYDKGLRMILNFGHSFGHAIEKTKSVPHGIAVAQGMILACKLSGRKKFLQTNDYERIYNLIKKFGFEKYLHLSTSKLIDAIKKDKKKNMNHLDFVLLKSVGHPVITKISFQEIERFINTEQ